MRHAILPVLLFLPLSCGPSSTKPQLPPAPPFNARTAESPFATPQLPPAPPFNSHTAESPFATREGTTIVLQPSGLRFAIPKDWIDWYDQFGNNLHLTAKELDRVGHGAGDWDDEYARVCNVIFPFDRCAAHVGGDGWGKEGVAYSDLQVRVYDLESPLKTIEENMGRQNPEEIGRLIDGSVQVQQGDKDGWRQTILSYKRFYYDYGATAHVDIRLKQIDRKTIAFVFMYTNYQSQEMAITDMLHSLRTGRKDFLDR